MYWDGVAGHQKTSVFLVNDPTFAYIDVKVNKYGTLKLAKVDEDGNKVAGTSSVSYTHLDVYKRQDVDCPYAHGREVLYSKK